MPTLYNFAMGGRSTAAYKLHFVHGWDSISPLWYH